MKYKQRNTRYKKELNGNFRIEKWNNKNKNLNWIKINIRLERSKDRIKIYIYIYHIYIYYIYKYIYFNACTKSVYWKLKMLMKEIKKSPKEMEGYATFTN